MKRIRILDKLGLSYKCYSKFDIRNLKTDKYIRIINAHTKTFSLEDDIVFVRILNPEACILSTHYYWDYLSSELEKIDDNYIFFFSSRLRLPFRGESRNEYWTACRSMHLFYQSFGWCPIAGTTGLSFDFIFVLRTGVSESLDLAAHTAKSKFLNPECVYPDITYLMLHSEEEISQLQALWNLVDSKVATYLYSLGIVLPGEQFITARECITMETKTKYAFGIDLGTTNSCIAVSAKNAPAQIIKLRTETKAQAATLPSCVMYTADKTIVGKTAYEQRYDAAHVVYSSKRDIGSDTVYPITVEGKSLHITPVDVAAEILRSLKEQAEEFYGEVKDVTITVPAYFEADARHATIEAATKAGLNVLALINEPTAAALNYASTSDKSERVLVYDLGGGTFDVTLLDISRTDVDDMSDIFGEAESSGVYTRVLSTGGNRSLGGDDLDRIVADLAIEHSERAFAEDYPNVNKSLAEYMHADYPILYEQLVLKAEQLKKNLSSAESSVIDIELGADEFCPDRIRISFNESLFIEAANQIFARTVDIITQCFTQAQVPYSSVDKVILIGGSTKLKFIREALVNFMEKHGLSSSHIYSNINPDEAVALGASINSAIYFGDSEMMVSDVLSQSIGIAEKTMIGDKITNDQYHKLIPKNSSIPHTITYTTTVQANQTEACILVYQGDDPLLGNNTHIGTIHLAVPCVDILQRIDISLLIDASGSLKITAESGGNSISTKLENILRPAAQDTNTAKVQKSNARLSRFINSLKMYASKTDYATGMNLIERYKQGDKEVNLADIRHFVSTVTQEGYTKDQQRLQKELDAAASLTNVFKASGASSEDDIDEDT